MGSAISSWRSKHSCGTSCWEEKQQHFSFFEIFFYAEQVLLPAEERTVASQAETVWTSSRVLSSVRIGWARVSLFHLVFGFWLHKGVQLEELWISVESIKRITLQCRNYPSPLSIQLQQPTFTKLIPGIPLGCKEAVYRITSSIEQHQPSHRLKVTIYLVRLCSALMAFFSGYSSHGSQLEQQLLSHSSLNPVATGA
jgi:hypothetical protein